MEEQNQNEEVEGNRTVTIRTTRGRCAQECTRRREQADGVRAHASVSYTRFSQTAAGQGEGGGAGVQRVYV